VDLRILDLDGSLPLQLPLLRRYRPTVHDLRKWGPQIRLGCGFGRFGHFETGLANTLGSETDAYPAFSFVGSGDFHHVTLALLRRIAKPFNLLILDNHPDWMRRIPFLHCGTWVHHAANLPNVRNIFHVGGDVDFDNGFRWLAPWPALRSGKIQVISAIRPFLRGAWKNRDFPALRTEPHCLASSQRIEKLIDPFRPQLERLPLYVSIDKDVLTTKDAVVNWDSGYLSLPEVLAVLNAFAAAADSQIAGIDTVGDWSPVQLQGWGQKLLHLTEHPRLDVKLAQAVHCNQRTNLELLKWATKLASGLVERTGGAGLAVG
jgi:hypothetical protein